MPENRCHVSGWTDQDRSTERGGLIVDALLLVAAITLVGIGSVHLLGNLMRGELEATAERQVLAFNDYQNAAQCPDGWKLADHGGRADSGASRDVNGDGLVCEQRNWLRSSNFIDNTLE